MVAYSIFFLTQVLYVTNILESVNSSELHFIEGILFGSCVGDTFRGFVLNLLSIFVRTNLPVSETLLLTNQTKQLISRKISQ